jgi:hypothetical protein
MTHGEAVFLLAAIAMPVLLVALALHSVMFLASAGLFYSLSAGIGLAKHYWAHWELPSITPMLPFRPLHI